MQTYEQRVRAYEAKGCTTSDAQSVVDAEDQKGNTIQTTNKVTDKLVNEIIDCVEYWRLKDGAEMKKALIGYLEQAFKEVCNAD